MKKRTLKEIDIPKSTIKLSKSHEVRLFLHKQENYQSSYKGIIHNTSVIDSTSLGKVLSQLESEKYVEKDICKHCKVGKIVRLLK